MRQWPWFLLSIMVLIADQLSKYFVSLYLIPWAPLSIMPMMNFTLAYNTGAAFSFLSTAGEWHRWFFAGFSFLVSVILALWIGRAQLSRLQLLGASLILGGAVGNLVDRVVHGYVIDFIDFYYKNHHFATFNVADSAICIGAGCFVLELLMNQPKSSDNNQMVF